MSSNDNPDGETPEHKEEHKEEKEEHKEEHKEVKEEVKEEGEHSVPPVPFEKQLWKASMFEIYFNQMMNAFKDNVKSLDSQSVIPVCLELMKFAERFSIEGAQKKELVIAVLQELCTILGVNPALLVLIPVFIDSIISVERGNIVVSVKPENLMSCCFSFCSKLKK